MKIFNWYEILKSTGKNWIVANDKVYDITQLFEIHPGGKKCLINHIGKDCTLDYNFHSKNGKLEWKKYQIGYIKKKECCIIL